MWTDTDEKQLEELLDRKDRYSRLFKAQNSLLDTLVNAKNNKCLIDTKYSVSIRGRHCPSVDVSIHLEGTPASHFLECEAL